MSSTDKELKALPEILELLRSFDHETRSRIWRWVTARLDADEKLDELERQISDYVGKQP